MRHRETTSGPDTKNCDWFQRRANGSQLSRTRTTVANGTFKSIDDVEVPRFSALKKCGEILPLNPVTIVTDSRTNRPISGLITQIPGATWYWEGEYQAVDNIPWQDWTGPNRPWFLAPGVIPEPDPSIIAAVRLAALAKLKSKRWDILTLLAEMDATIDTLAGLLRLLTSRTHRLKQLREARKDPKKFFSEKWLEWRYGIRPILFDARDAWDTFQALQGELDLLLTGKSGQTVEENQSIDTGLDNEHAHFSLWWEREVRWEYSYRGFALARFESKGARLLTSDLLVSAWELTTLSFVADWFIDVGSYVSGLSSWLFNEVESSCTSTKLTVHAGTSSGFTPDGAHSPAGSIITTQPGYAGLKREMYVRTPVAGPPPFPLFAGLSNMDFPKWADLLALALQFKAGKPYAQRR